MPAYMEEVEGEPVVMPGFEEFSFFSHHQVITDKWGIWDDHCISEVSSGCRIAGAFTPAEALTKAKKHLSSITKEEFQNRLKRVLTIIK